MVLRLTYCHFVKSVHQNFDPSNWFKLAVISKWSELTVSLIHFTNNTRKRVTKNWRAPADATWGHMTIFLSSWYSLEHPHPVTLSIPEIRATTSVKGTTSYKLKPSPFCQLLGKPSVLCRSFWPQPKVLNTPPLIRVLLPLCGPPPINLC